VKRFWFLYIIILSFLSCGSTKGITRVYNSSYEDVWKATLIVVERDLNYPIKKKDFKDGVILTDYVTNWSFDLVTKSKLNINIKKGEKGVTFNIKRNIAKMVKENKQRKTKKGERLRAKWVDMKSDGEEEMDIINRIEEKLSKNISIP
jgi:hypothetical protein